LPDQNIINALRRFGKGSRSDGKAGSRSDNTAGGAVTGLNPSLRAPVFGVARSLESQEGRAAIRLYTSGMFSGLSCHTPGFRHDFIGYIANIIQILAE